MKTASKKISDTRVEIKVTLDAADLKEAHAKALVQLAANLKVQGFRKGKVPASMVEKHVAPNEIANTTMEVAVRSTMPGVFAKAKLAPIYIEQTEVTKYVPDDNLEYTVKAEVLPEIKLGDFKKLKAKLEKTEPTAKEVEEIVDGVASAYSEKVVVKRAAKDGDEVIIDFVGKHNGEKFPGGSAKDYHLELGSHQFIPGFEEGIVGHSSGDKFDLEVTFPKDYPEKTLAGQKAVFEVLLKQVNEIKLPTKNDELAQKCGNFQTMDDLRADIKKNITAQKRHVAVERYRDALVADLVKASKVVAPEILIKDQMRFILDDMRRNAASHGLQLEEYIERGGKSFDEWHKEALEVAEQRVKSSLVLQVLAQEQGIQATDEEVEAKVMELRDLYQKSPEAIKSLKKPEVRQDIKNRLIIDKTLDFLVKSNGGEAEAIMNADPNEKQPSPAKKPATMKSTKTKKTDQK